MIAINKSGDSFVSRWIQYCDSNNIEYIIVDCFSEHFINDILNNNVKVFMWHHSHMKGKDIIASKYIFNTLEHYGLKVFPKYEDNWHFDDKIAQAYLSSIFDLPFVKSYVFYDKTKALNFIEKFELPIVAKLKGGSGSSNVRLLRNKYQAKQYINKSFGKGFKNYSPIDNLKERYRKYKKGIAPFRTLIAGIYRFVVPTDYAIVKGKEQGYVYFQEFIPNNFFDIRVIVIDNKAFAIKRMVRENDFRASGGGNIIYDCKQIPIECIKVSFEVCKKLNFNCMSFDFVFKEDKPLIVEFSYGFRASAYDKCQGFWDENLNLIEESFNPYGWMVEQILK